MPEIASFRGILYDKSKVELARVVAPPPGAIEPAARAQLAAADPHNVVRLVQPEADGGLGGGAVAARTLAAWLASGVLVRDPYKAIYRYVQHFRDLDDGRPRFRRGFIAAVRLDTGDGRIQTHQHVFPSVRDEQIALTGATSAHLSPPTALYADASGEVERVLRPCESKPPTLDVTTADGVRHVVWRVQDAELVGKLRRAMAPKKLVLADGHHELAAMLALRDRCAAHAAGGLAPYSSAHYGTMFLCNLADDGLVVLPQHRLLHGVAGFDPKTLLERARAYFIVEPVAGAARDPAAVRRALDDAPGHQPAMVVAFPGQPDGWRLTLDPHVDPGSLGVTGHAAVVRTGVTLLHGVVLDRILGLTAAAQEPRGNVRHVADLAAAQAALASHQAGFFLAPVKLDSLRQIAEQGDALPARATLFYPRLAAGLVVQHVDPDEDLV